MQVFFRLWWFICRPMPSHRIPFRFIILETWIPKLQGCCHAPIHHGHANLQILNFMLKLLILNWLGLASWVHFEYFQFLILRCGVYSWYVTTYWLVEAFRCWNIVVWGCKERIYLSVFIIFIGSLCLLNLTDCLSLSHTLKNWESALVAGSWCKDYGRPLRSVSIFIIWTLRIIHSKLRFRKVVPCGKDYLIWWRMVATLFQSLTSLLLHFSLIQSVKLFKRGCCVGNIKIVVIVLSGRPSE